MSFEKLQSSIETVREEEVVNAWLESQKKATRYTTKAPEGEEPKVFHAAEDALAYLRTEERAKIVKQVNYARVHGTVLEKYPETEAYKAMDGERMRQQRFPLDTANAIRGRMRREKFSIYKKGAKGVTYVCSTKRNFRAPGQVMSPDLDRIIHFLESNQSIKAKEFSNAYESWLKAEGVEVAFDEKKLMRDLHWLIADGYVSHFEDDTLFAQPILETGAKGGEHAGSSSSQDKKPAKKVQTAEKAETSSEEAAPAATPASAVGEQETVATENPSEVADASEAEASTPEPESDASPSERSEEPSKTSESPEETAAAPPTQAVEAEPETVVEEAEPKAEAGAEAEAAKSEAEPESELPQTDTASEELKPEAELAGDEPEVEVEAKVEAETEAEVEVETAKEAPTEPDSLVEAETAKGSEEEKKQESNKA